MTHIGAYIRQTVLPSGISVTKVAQILGVGRPALSNLLNGRAALSPEMAKRFEKAFGVSAAELLQKQTAYEISMHETDRGAFAKAVEFVPPFLMVKANDIVSWADTHGSRHQLAVFLRKLIHSTCDGLEYVNFPGNDDSQRKGWDGHVKSSVGNPWVPSGVTCWEFGTGGKARKKADSDYLARTKSTQEEVRKETVFVFVTPRRWEDKESWIAERRAEGKWRDVLAWDANDLEQWLELSIAGQVWFDAHWGQNLGGAKSLELCWREWCADCEPSFTHELFAEAISSLKDQLLAHLERDSTGILRVIADSKQEGLAFIAALLFSSGEESCKLVDKMVVFTKPGILSKLATESKGFIPVITNEETEKELAEIGFPSKALVVEHQNPISSQATISLRPLSTQAFREALESLGLGPDEINMLDKKTGRSITVLRRCLARNEQLKHPVWANKERYVSSLSAMALAGVWKSNNEADNILIRELAKVSSDSWNSDFKQLLEIEDSPVWSIGDHRGVTSKLDVLYGLARSLTEDMFERFLDVAEIVLFENDPSLELPEEHRWAAVIYEKTREFSDALRRSLGESLVLLAIHGDWLFAKQVTDPEGRIANLVQKLLDPLTESRLLSQCSNLPVYAEAAPETFLKIFAQDLQRPKPIVESLMKPANDTLFGRNERVHLLWALELLAWHPEWLIRVVDLLGALSELEPDDNLSNKPSNSLMMIFRHWMPQTGATLEQRVSAVERLKERHPKVAWRILSDQITPGRQIGEFAHKPTWRDYAVGLGALINSRERSEFLSFCVNTCIDWPSHTTETLKELIQKTERLDLRHLRRLNESIIEWNRNVKDEERSVLHEHIRVNIGLIRLQGSDKSPIDKERIDRIDVLENAAEMIEPTDIVWRYAWLFRKYWVDEPYSGTEKDLDHKSRDERIRKMRIRAIRDVNSESGFEGVIRLALSGNAPEVAGLTFVAAFKDRATRFSFLQTVLENAKLEKSRPHQSLVSGVFSALGSSMAIEFLKNRFSEDGANFNITRLLCLLKFESVVWKSLKFFGEDEERSYWSEVVPYWEYQESEDINFAVAQLLHAGRPFAALEFAYLDWEKVESTHIHAILSNLNKSTEYEQQYSHVPGYHVAEALTTLQERAALPRSELARLELIYLDQLRIEECGIPNLEREIELQPEFFGDLVAITVHHRDEEEDRTQISSELVFTVLSVFEELTRIPGYGIDNVLDAEIIKDWVRRVQSHCELNRCSDQGDYRIGELLAKAPSEEDGAWPCRPVCTALETVVNDQIERGVVAGRSNFREAQIRTRGGDQEREKAGHHDEWANRYELEFPRVAAVLRKIASSLRDEAKFWDDDEAIRERSEY